MKGVFFSLSRKRRIPVVKQFSAAEGVKFVLFTSAADSEQFYG